MQIKIDSKVIAERLTACATKAVENAFQSYEVRSLVLGKIADKVIGEAVVAALDDAVDQLDLKMLASALAKELQKAVVAATVHTLRENTVEMVYRMRGGSPYASDAEERRAEIRAKLGLK